MWCPSERFLHRAACCKTARPILLAGYALLIYLCLGNVAAQRSVASESKYIITHYTTENGLPQNSIKGLAFDELGYCWIGTENGLVKYDGIKFRLYEDYRVPRVSARVLFVKQGSDKQILIGFEGGQLYRIRTTDYFGTVPVADSGRYLWGNGRGVLRVNDPVSSHFFNLLATHTKKIDDNCFLIGNSQLYIRTGDSLIIAGPDAAVKVVPWKDFRADAATVIDKKFVGIINRKTAVVIGRNGQISRRLRLGGKFFEDMDMDSGNYSLIWTDSATYGFCKGTLYRLAFLGDGIASLPIITGLGNISVSDIYLDAGSGTYYLQSRTDGLIVAKQRRFENIRIPDADWKKNSFYGQNLYGKDQIIANGYLFSFHSGQPQNIKLASVGSLYSALVDGDYYYYESDFKLFKLGLKTGNSSLVAELNDLAHCFVRSSYDSVVYLSTTDKLFSLKDGRLTEKLSVPSGVNRYIYSFAFAGKDSVLIATSRGLWSGNLLTGQAREIIPGINVRSIYLGKGGYTWLATYNQGCFVGKDGHFRQVPMDPTRRIAVVNSIVEDRRGRIWFSTNNGLLSTQRYALLDYLSGSGLGVIYHIYDQSDGLLTNEFNGAATPDKVYLSDGRVSLPSLKSLVLFNPGTFPVDSSGQKVFLDEVLVDGRRSANISNLGLSPGLHSMVISVSTPWTNKREALQFERKVDGYDSDWVTLGASDKIELRGLTYGDYQFRVRVKGRPGSQMQFQFHVAPFFYETHWFKLSISLATILIIILFFRSSIRHYQSENLVLDRRIKLRTQELNESLEKLHMTVSQLQRAETRLRMNVQQKEQIINMLLHDMKSPLFALKSGIEELDYRLGLQASVTDDILRKSRLLLDGISDVYSFSVNFFDWVKYQKEGITANYQLTNLNEVFTTIGELYGGIARRKGIDLDITPCQVSFYTDENILVTILRNLVDNAIKNTRSGRVSIRADIGTGNLTITVQDTGPGMEPAKLEMFNEAFLVDNGLEGQSGYGYRLIAHLATLIHADVELENHVGLQVRVFLNLITTAHGL